VGSACGTHGRGKKIVQGFLCESPNEGGLSEDLGVDGRMGKKLILGRLAGGVWSRFGWLRIGIGGGLL
jgi:hypothetical protein